MVSEVYNLLMGDLDVREDNSLNCIWKARVSPRVRTFFWKVQRERLPTRAMLHQSRCTVTVDCAWCTGQVENLDHLLCTCSVSSLLWPGSMQHWVQGPPLVVYRT